MLVAATAAEAVVVADFIAQFFFLQRGDPCVLVPERPPRLLRGPPHPQPAGQRPLADEVHARRPHPGRAHKRRGERAAGMYGKMSSKDIDVRSL